MNKFGNCPLCGKQVKPTNLRKIARQNQLYGFRLALDGIAATWGALIQNLRCELGLTDEQVQKLIRIGDRYWEMVGEFKNEGMAPDEFAEYLVSKSEQVEKELRERWSEWTRNSLQLHGCRTLHVYPSIGTRNRSWSHTLAARIHRCSWLWLNVQESTSRWSTAIPQQMRRRRSISFVSSSRRWKSVE